MLATFLFWDRSDGVGERSLLNRDTTDGGDSELDTSRLLHLNVTDSISSCVLFKLTISFRLHFTIIILILQLGVCDVRAGGHGKPFDPS